MRRLYVGEMVKDMEGNETSSSYAYFDYQFTDRSNRCISELGVSFEFLEGYIAGVVNFLGSEEVEIHNSRISVNSDARRRMYPKAEFKPLSSELLDRLVKRSVPQTLRDMGLKIVLD